jgi:K+-sensing histidine kinase KdpD
MISMGWRGSALSKRLDSVWAEHPYLAITALIAVVTGIGLIVGDKLHPANLTALYLLVVLAAALKWQQRPALFAAGLSAVLFDFCFVPPRFSFAFSDAPYLITFLEFTIVAIATSELASRAHEVIRLEASRTQIEATIRTRDTLFDTVSHELRGPVNTILGWVQILRASSGDPERSRRALAALERNARRLARLAGDLLDASRIHSGKLTVQLEPLMIAPVVLRALDDATIAAQNKNIQCHFDIQPVGTVFGDANRIEQIVTNLVVNAIKFTPSGGSVNVSLSQIAETARLVVSDTGAGIPPEFLPHIFDRFTQAPGPSQPLGLGLGLAIVKHLVSAHHGTIKVESLGAGQGARFVVDLPSSPAVSNPNISHCL